MPARSSLRKLEAQMMELRDLRAKLIAQGKTREADKLEPEYQELLARYRLVVREARRQ